MKQALLPAVMLATFAISGIVTAQDLQGIELNPGERLVAVDGVPVDQAVQQANYTAPVTPGNRGVIGQTVGHAANIVGNLVPSGLAFSHTPGATALDKANAERARNGQRALMPDPQLQVLALRKATIAAQRGHKNHIGGSLGGAACEGVGHTNGRFLTCCLDEPGSYGGAAMVQGRDGWYCCLLVR
jgi:hypothetical protein